MSSPKSSVRSELEDWADFIRVEGHVLTRHPSLLFQQAANQPGTTAPAIAASQSWSQGRHRRRWLSWINKPLERDPVLFVLSAGRYFVTECRFTPDGKSILTLAGELRRWIAATGALDATLAPDLDASAFAVSSDGRRIAVGFTRREPGKLVVDRSAVSIIDLGTGETLGMLDHEKSKILSIGFSFDNRFVATGTEDQLVRVWDSVTFRELHRFRHENRPQACVFSPREAVVAVPGGSWSNRYVVTLWSVETGALLMQLDHEKDVYDCAFSPDGNSLVVACQDNTLSLWDLRSARLRTTLKGHTFDVRACDWSADGRLIVSGSGDRTVRLWDAATGAQVAVAEKHTSRVLSCAFSPSGEAIVSGDQDRSAIVWNLSAVLTERAKRTRASCNGGAFSPDSSELASASGDVLVWNVSSGEHVQTLKGDDKDFLYDCAWSPDASMIAASSHNGMLTVWHRSTGTRIFSARVSAENVGHVHCCSFSPDGRLLAAAAPWMISIFDAKTWRLVRTIEYHKVGVGWCVFSADSRQLLDDHLQLWDIGTGARVAVFGDGNAEYSSVRAFSPDHSRALVNVRRELLVVDLASGDTLMSLPAPEGGVHARYTRDSRRIVTASSREGELIVWDAALGKPIVNFVAGSPLRSVIAAESHVACGTADVTYLLEMREQA